ncbi:MAG: hypothetical protein V3S40_05530 [Kiloniellales bacterium]
METYLERLIRTALVEARAAGLDYPGQTNRALSEVMRMRPDMTDTEALTAVDRVHRDIPGVLGGLV